jgi:hypothetical protein
LGEGRINCTNGRTAVCTNVMLFCFDKRDAGQIAVQSTERQKRCYCIFKSHSYINSKHTSHGAPPAVPVAAGRTSHPSSLRTPIYFISIYFTPSAINCHAYSLSALRTSKCILPVCSLVTMALGAAANRVAFAALQTRGDPNSWI